MDYIKATDEDTGKEYKIVGFTSREKFSLDAVIIQNGRFYYRSAVGLICDEESLYST